MAAAVPEGGKAVEFATLSLGTFRALDAFVGCDEAVASTWTRNHYWALGGEPAALTKAVSGLVERPPISTHAAHLSGPVSNPGNGGGTSGAWSKRSIVSEEMNLVDDFGEQYRLEKFLDASAPQVPEDCQHLDYLLFTPVCYAARNPEGGAMRWLPNYSAFASRPSLLHSSGAWQRSARSS